MIAVQGELVALMQPLICTDERLSDGALCGLRIEPAPEGGALLVATNGHALGVMHDPRAMIDRGAERTVRVSKDLAKLCKGRPREDGDAERWLVVEDHSARVVLSERGAQGAVEAEGHLVSMVGVVVARPFPNWRANVPTIDEDRPAWTTYDLELLSVFKDIAKTTNSLGKMARIISVRACGPRQAGLVRVARDDFFGVVMPVTPGPTRSCTPPFAISGGEDERDEDDAADAA